MISITTVIIVAIVCVITEGFFSGSEIAMVSASKGKLRQRAQAGDRGARLAEEFMAKPQVLLATTLMGTNMATVTFSVIVALALLGRQTASSELVAIALVAPVTLILGELVPKTVFQRYADFLAPKVVYPLRVASIVLRPAVWVVSGFALIVTRILGVDAERAFVTKEELALLIEARSPGSDITRDEREMISNVLELSDSVAVDVMVPLSEVTALPLDTTVAEAKLEIADKRHSRMPVYEGRIDNIVGILHVFNILQATSDDQLISEMTQPVHFVPENQPAADLLVDLQGRGHHMAVVVDEYGGAVGLATVEDILEEVVGEIDDEFDAEPSQIKQDRPGVWSIHAKTSVAKINEELVLDLPESDEFESIGGLVLEHFKRIPDAGESIVIGSVTIHVVEASDRAVERVQLLRGRKR